MTETHNFYDDNAIKVPYKSGTILYDEASNYWYTSFTLNNDGFKSLKLAKKAIDEHLTQAEVLPFPYEAFDVYRYAIVKVLRLDPNNLEQVIAEVLYRDGVSIEGSAEYAENINRIIPLRGRRMGELAREAIKKDYALRQRYENAEAKAGKLKEAVMMKRADTAEYLRQVEEKKKEYGE